VITNLFSVKKRFFRSLFDQLFFIAGALKGLMLTHEVLRLAEQLISTGSIGDRESTSGGMYMSENLTYNKIKKWW
jgi:hypothetical protein